MHLDKYWSFHILLFRVMYFCFCMAHETGPKLPKEAKATRKINSDSRENSRKNYGHDINFNLSKLIVIYVCMYFKASMRTKGQFHQMSPTKNMFLFYFEREIKLVLYSLFKSFGAWNQIYVWLHAVIL